MNNISTKSIVMALGLLVIAALCVAVFTLKDNQKGSGNTPSQNDVSGALLKTYDNNDVSFIYDSSRWQICEASPPASLYHVILAMTGVECRKIGESDAKTGELTIQISHTLEGRPCGKTYEENYRCELNNIQKKDEIKPMWEGGWGIVGVEKIETVTNAFCTHSYSLGDINGSVPGDYYNVQQFFDNAIVEYISIDSRALGCSFFSSPEIIPIMNSLRVTPSI